MKYSLITSAYSVPLNGETPDQIMFFPAGTSKIRANVNGKPKHISVTVDQKTAGVMQASLAELLKEPVEPFIDFNHKGEEAAAHPKGFEWKDGEGVMLNLEWTTGGKSSVEGKSYRYFSPTFLISEDGEPSSLPESGPVGALTNNPAFRRMKKISASDEGAATGDDEPPKQKGKTMAEEATETVMAALRTELDTLRTENKSLKESIEAQRVQAVEREADLLIEAAVRDHKIEPKNEKVKASIKKLFVNDAGLAREAIELLPVNAAFKTIINHKAGDRDTGKPPGTSRAVELNSIVKAVQANHPGMSWADAWDLAESEHPDKFGTSVVRA